jgi:Spy/CpxP family protein refolding chaperone
MRSPKLIALTLVAMLALSAAYATADAPQTGAPAGPPAHGRFQAKLGLTDDQMNAIREIHARRADERKQLWQSLRQAQADLRQLALNGGDPAAIKAKAAEVAGLLSQGVEMRAATLQEIAPILTAEQRDQLSKMSPRGHWRHGPRPTQGS